MPANLPAVLQTAGEMQRRWRDGSLEEDLPMRGLRWAPKLLLIVN